MKSCPPPHLRCPLIHLLTWGHPGRHDLDQVGFRSPLAMNPPKVAAIGAQPLERASTTCAVRLCSLLEVVTKANTTKHCLGKRPLSQTQTYGSAGANLRDRCCRGHRWARYLTHGTLRDEHQEVSSEPLMTRDLVVTERESEPFSS